MPFFYETTSLKLLKRRYLLSIVVTTVLTLPGCMVGPDYQTPDPGKQLQISQITYPDVRFEQTDLSHWWDIFNDPLLSSYINRGEQHNLDLQIAMARVKEARAVLGITDSGLYPAVDANGSIAWGKNSESVNPFITGENTLYSLAGDASWEIDFFGRVRRSIEAASADYQASWEDHNSVLITIRAEIAATYLQIRTFQAQLNTSQKNISSQKGMLRLTQVRYDNGIATYLDVAQATRVLAFSEAELPTLRAQLNQSLTSLSVLTGLPSDALRLELREVTPIPLPPDTIATGIPAERIRQRPDIRGAERRVAAATARIGVATADLYPSFSLTGTFGFASLSGSSLFDSASQAYGIGPSLRWNIFDMGKIRQQIAVQDARTEQALLSYELTMRQAIKEVEDSLNIYHEQWIRLIALGSYVKASEETLSMSSKLYKDGLTSFQDVLDAQLSLLKAENDMDLAQGNTAIQLVVLYKALAGGWTTQEQTP